MKSIYLDEEGEEALKVIRKEDPNFNLSSHVKESLLRFRRDAESIEELTEQLNEYKLKEQEYLSKQESIRSKIARIQVREQMNKEEKVLQEEKQKAKILEREKNFKLFVGEIFDVKEIDLDLLAAEYKESSLSIPEFMKSKGYTEKQIK